MESKKVSIECLRASILVSSLWYCSNKRKSCLRYLFLFNNQTYSRKKCNVFTLYVHYLRTSTEKLFENCTTLPYNAN